MTFIGYYLHQVVELFIIKLVGQHFGKVKMQILIKDSLKAFKTKFERKINILKI